MGRLVVQDLGLQVEGMTEPLSFQAEGVRLCLFLCGLHQPARKLTFGSQAVRGVAAGCIGGSSYSPEVILPIEERRSLHGMHPASASLAMMATTAGCCPLWMVIRGVDVNAKAYDVTQGCKCTDGIV